MSDQPSRIGQESGPTKADPTALTIDALQREIAQLHELVMQHIEDYDLRYQQRFEAQERAIAAALTSMKEAVTKAETATEKRFESVNEFRSQLNDQQTTFLTRVEYNAAHQSLVEKSDDTKLQVAGLIAAGLGSREGRSQMSDSVKLAIAIIGSVVLLIGFFLAQKGGP